MTDHILRYTATSLTLTWYVDGDATDVGDVTIGITSDDGDTIVAAGTATTNNADGTYTYAVSNTLTATPDLWTATWTDTSTGDDVTTRIEVVGAHLFTEAEARAWHDSALTSATKYTDAWIAEQRVRITDEFEGILGRSPIPRYRRETLTGSGGHVLRLERPGVSEVVAATINGTAQTVGDLVVVGASGDQLHHTTATWTEGTTSNPRNVKVEYVHGLDAPADLKRAALTVLHKSVTSNVDEALRFLSPGAGAVQLPVAGRGGAWYGIPSVDAVLNRRRLLTVVG